MTARWLGRGRRLLLLGRMLLRQVCALCSWRWGLLRRRRRRRRMLLLLFCLLLLLLPRLAQPAEIAQLRTFVVAPPLKRAGSAAYLALALPTGLAPLSGLAPLARRHGCSITCAARVPLQHLLLLLVLLQRRRRKQRLLRRRLWNGRRRCLLLLGCQVYAGSSGRCEAQCAPRAGRRGGHTLGGTAAVAQRKMLAAGRR